ncbi:MAG: YcaQ family DNA glycosylase [Archangium sp.]|nr:YcaQ family DNA glycosylase [Archangium sp.]
MRAVTRRDLARAAIANTFFAPTTLLQAVRRLGFVQADPIRAPARAQDLILRHRVRDYRAGQLEARYPALAVEEDLFTNYGFLPREVVALMHPRKGKRKWTKLETTRADQLREFVHQRGEAHPDEVERAFSHGRVKNPWGGTSRATTSLLEAMHHRGLVRIARRENGVRVFGRSRLSASELDDETRARTLLDLAITLYAPVSSSGLRTLIRFLRAGARDLQPAMRKIARTLEPDVTVDGVSWFGFSARPPEPEDVVRFLAPFDPLVWDRARFEFLWGWAYRFEAYTPVSKRVRGYYALPLLWRDEVIGWANVTTADHLTLGFVRGRPPRERPFVRALEAEVARLRAFLKNSASDI